MIAKFFTEKIVELGVPLRRERKQAQSEAKENNQEPVKDKADMVINLIDFPRNQEELEVFLKYRNAINKVIVVREKKPKGYDKMLKDSQKPKQPAVEGEGAPGQLEEPPKPKLVSAEEREHVSRFVRAYDFKCYHAPNHSVLKLSDLKILHYEHIIEQQKEGQPDAGKLKNSVNDLKERLTSEVKKSEKKLISYCNEILKHKPESRPATAKTPEKEETKELVAEDSQEKPKAPVELIPAGFQERICQLATEQEETGFEESENLRNHKNWFDFSTYAKNTTKINYNNTTVSHLLISAIKHVATLEKPKETNFKGIGVHNGKDLIELESILQADFQPTDTSHIFNESSDKSEANKSRSFVRNGDKNVQIEKIHHDDEPEHRAKIVHGSPYHMLFEKIDQLSMQNYLLQTLDGTKMRDIEVKMLQNMLLPGTKRNGMPATPEKSLPVRKAEVNEISSFSTIGKEQIERALILQQFTKMMKEKEGERDWSFYNRNYVKVLNKDTLKHEISKYLLLSPNITTKYYAREDGLLLSMYFKNPPGRILRHQWTKDFENSKEFRKYLTSIGMQFHSNKYR